MDAIEAQFPDKCAACGEAILVGELIIKNEDGDWIHEDCDSD